MFTQGKPAYPIVDSKPPMAPARFSSSSSSSTSTVGINSAILGNKSAAGGIRYSADETMGAFSTHKNNKNKYIGFGNSNFGNKKEHKTLSFGGKSKTYFNNKSKLFF